MTLQILDVSDPTAPTLDGRPLESKVTISRGRRHPNGPLVPTEVEIGGVQARGVQVMRNGRVIAVVPEG